MSQKGKLSPRVNSRILTLKKFNIEYRLRMLSTFHSYDDAGSRQAAGTHIADCNSACGICCGVASTRMEIFDEYDEAQHDRGRVCGFGRLLRYGSRHGGPAGERHHVGQCSAPERAAAIADDGIQAVYLRSGRRAQLLIVALR
jgi:hypothetical protein